MTNVAKKAKSTAALLFAALFIFACVPINAGAIETCVFETIGYYYSPLSQPCTYKQYRIEYCITHNHQELHHVQNVVIHSTTTTTTISPHTGSQHFVTVRCSECNVVTSSSSYSCPGNPCRYPS
jgi:hypothetical protein